MRTPFARITEISAVSEMGLTRLLGMSGSLRSGSHSNAVLQTLREKFGAHADLRIYDLQSIPPYNQDFEGEKRPAPVKDLLTAIAESDGLVLCAPEFNHSIPGVLKNALDSMLARVTLAREVTITASADKVRDGRLVDETCLGFACAAVEALLHEIRLWRMAEPRVS